MRLRLPWFRGHVPDPATSPMLAMIEARQVALLRRVERIVSVAEEVVRARAQKGG